VSEAVQQGTKVDNATVAELHRRYGGWLYNAVRARFGREDCEDLVQETWLRVSMAEARNALTHPKAFLLRVATNLALTQYRHRRIVARNAGPGLRQCDQPADQIERLALTEIVLGLPQPLRDVFVLSRFGGLTNSQIAGQLGISPKTVEKRMTKALAHCAAQLRL
jgi:RNA polymerase sigma factor (sigma-70 family)